jgi:hypothetical protein
VGSRARGTKVLTRSLSGYPQQPSILLLLASQSPALRPPLALLLALLSHVTLLLFGSCPHDGCSCSAVPVRGQGLHSS